MFRRRRNLTSHPPLGRALRSDRALNVRPIGRARWSFADIYHLLLRMTWPRVTLTFVGAFVVLNLLFATAYSLDPTGVYWGARPVNAPLFWRALFFSIDTVATVGYGNMYPVSVYANVLVVIEITLGAMFFAITTGIAFARFSRPTARILFSRVAVVANVDGVPTLMFRAANLRHNLVFEARASVSVLVDETVGATTMRRFKDLNLVREKNPVFTLTWMIMHPIDADSPIAQWMPGAETPPQSELIVVLAGTDDRTGQTMHGRWAYTPADVRWDTRFVDILGQAADGTRTIDYRRFHDIEPSEPH
ncbi:inward rectifier potassium channel [Sphingomonas sp. F9_3S_D5_B_2]